ncbi:MAG: antibiotic biosynthesis monooxygenase [Actinomycetota bacterium]|nr:antibiotic biosynthesis monooxygenase [Actinomycetota bacterium]
MSLPVLTGFAGVLVAAVATGLLAGRCVRQPRADGILWTVATLGLTVALAAQSLGFASGFGPATFRAVELCALLLAPLALAWGLVEFVAQSGAARFGVRLVSSALIVVATVILATDPLPAQPFSKSWPSAGAYSQPFSRYALDAAQVVAVTAVVVCVGLAFARARNDPSWRPARLAVALLGLAVLVTVALRLSLPGRSGYPLLSLIAAALAWSGATRIPDLPEASHPGPGDPGPDLPDWAVDDAHRVGRGYARDATSAPGLGPGPGPASARPYGRILIFTLHDDRVADFDRLAGHAAERVRTAEPGTLVYVIHLVPNAPLQRIFYEIYRDQAAFDRHEDQPYMRRFVADRRACVLATNVIELRLTHAKIAPLPAPQPVNAAPPAGPPPAAWPSAGPWPPRPANLPQPPHGRQPLPGARPDWPSQLPSAARRDGNG